MLVRKRFEVEYGLLFDKFRMGSTVWSPLHGGLLTGKYNNGIPKESRIGMYKERYEFLLTEYNKLYGEENKAKTAIMFKELEDLAKSLGGNLV